MVLRVIRSARPTLAAVSLAELIFFLAAHHTFYLGDHREFCENRDRK